MINKFFSSLVILFAVMTLSGCGGGASENTTQSASPLLPKQLSTLNMQSLDILSRDSFSAPIVSTDADSITITHSGSGLSDDGHYQFFLNIDNDASTGYQFAGDGWDQAGADYIIEDGDLFKSTANNSTWSWGTDVGVISHTKTESSISVTINKSLLQGLTPIIRVGFLLRDSMWDATNIYPAASQMAQYSIDVVPPSDTTAPLLEKNGSSYMYVLLNSDFTDPGASAIDNIDGDITNNIVVESELDITRIGVYTIIYSITDAAGNSSSDTRLVEVINEIPNNIVIDGMTGDWLEIPILSQSNTTLIKTTDDQGMLYLLIDASNFSLGENTQIFLDTDNNPITGFQFNSQGWSQGGADYMIENNLLSKSMNNSSTWAWDFNVGEIDYIKRAGVIEIGIPTSLLTNLSDTLKVGFVSRDSEWNIRSVLPEIEMANYTISDSCSIATNNQQCNLEDVSKATKIEIDSQGIIYFLMSDKKLVYRWDSQTNQALTPINIGSITSSDNKATEMTYSKIHNRLYLGYDSGVISYINILTSVENSLTTLPLQVKGLVAIGNHLLAQDDSGAWATHYIIDKNGIITDSKDWNYYSRAYAWNSTLNRVYFFRDDTGPNDLHFEEIDPITGKITAKGETPYHGAHIFQPPIVTNEQGDLVLTGNGNIFNADDLTWTDAIPEDFTDGIWLDDDGLITIRPALNSTLLERRNNDLILQESLSFQGKPRGIFITSNSYVVITEENNNLVFNTYTPNNDTDGDGVLNTEDHFPLDPTASIDSDNDGYPDYWNTGYSDNDSTTGLILDNYPQESACFLLEQGDGVNCDISASISDFTPDQTVMGTDGTIYLLSNENRKVYRWSISDNNYMSPIWVGNNNPLNLSSPALMAYSENHNRLYFAYGNGQISYVDLSSTRLDEQEFTTLPLAVNGIISTGEFLLAQDNSGSRSIHYIFDKNGSLTDSKDLNRYSRAYAWNTTLNRVYFFRDNTSPNDLHYEEIDPSTGKIINDGETPYHGDYVIKPPILISPNGDQVLLGSKNIYNATSLVWETSITNTFEAGLWTENGDILTLRDTVNGVYLDHYDSSAGWIREQNYEGTLIGLYEYQNKYYVATKVVGNMIITEYTIPN